MKNFNEMSFDECVEYSRKNLDELRYSAKVYAVHETLDAFVIECYNEMCGTVEKWYHFYVRDVCSGKPVCFRAVDSKHTADKLWEWYTRPY